MSGGLLEILFGSFSNMSDKVLVSSDGSPPVTSDMSFSVLSDLELVSPYRTLPVTSGMSLSAMSDLELVSPYRTLPVTSDMSLSALSDQVFVSPCGTPPVTSGTVLCVMSDPALVSSDEMLVTSDSVTSGVLLPFSSDRVSCVTSGRVVEGRDPLKSSVQTAGDGGGSGSLGRGVEEVSEYSKLEGDETASPAQIEVLNIAIDNACNDCDGMLLSICIGKSIRLGRCAKFK